MRDARNWFFREFHPETAADLTKTMFSEHSGYFRMVTSYWDMAAALVNYGAISKDLFNDSNGEHVGVFAKLEPLLAECRSAFSPRFLANLEKLIDAMPDGRQRTSAAREQFKVMRAKMAMSQSQQPE